MAVTLPGSSIIYQSSGFSVNTQNTPVDWDINGDGLIEFQFVSQPGVEVAGTYLGLRSTYRFTSGAFLAQRVAGAPSIGAGAEFFTTYLNGRGFVSARSSELTGFASDNFATLPFGYLIGPDMQNRGFGTLSSFRNVMQLNATTSTGSGFTSFNAVGYDFNTLNGGTTAQPNVPHYIGFRFSDGQDGFYYGWASMTVDLQNDQILINNWAWDNSGAPIAAGAVPEPKTYALMGLGLLALGASDVRKWRKNKQQQS